MVSIRWKLKREGEYCSLEEIGRTEVQKSITYKTFSRKNKGKAQDMLGIIQLPNCGRISLENASRLVNLG